MVACIAQNGEKVLQAALLQQLAVFYKSKADQSAQIQKQRDHKVCKPARNHSPSYVVIIPGLDAASFSIQLSQSSSKKRDMPKLLLRRNKSNSVNSLRKLLLLRTMP